MLCRHTLYTIIERFPVRIQPARSRTGHKAVCRNQLGLASPIGLTVSVGVKCAETEPKPHASNCQNISGVCCCHQEEALLARHGGENATEKS